MGLCASQDPEADKQKERNDRIQAALKKDQQKIDNEDAKKMLLLGAGQSGKSTLFKQTQLLYGKKLKNEEMESYIPIIIGNTISSMQTLVEKSVEFAEEKKENRQKFMHKCPQEAKLVLESDKETLSPELGSAIKALWADEGIQNTYKEKHEFQLIDSAPYYFGAIDRIAQQNWFPDEEDVLRSRARTTGIVTTEFVVQEHHFKMFDVGGQKSERKKWVPFFEGVDCVLFVAAISGYNKTLFEDGVTNRIVDALNLFDKTVKEKMLEKSSLVLFLNKKDLFAEEIKRFPITVSPALHDYTGDGSFENCCDFIRSKFEARVPHNRAVTIHITCATDRKNVEVVFHSVREHVLNESLAAAGLTPAMAI